MRTVVGADHAGSAMKQAIAKRLAAAGHTVVGVGTHDGETPVDFADFAVAVGAEVLANRSERGILLCGSGVGRLVSANKLAGIRAGLCHTMMKPRRLNTLEDRDAALASIHPILIVKHSATCGISAQAHEEIAGLLADPAWPTDVYFVSAQQSRVVSNEIVAPASAPTGDAGRGSFRRWLGAWLPE